MAIRVTEAKRGMVIRYENELYQITKYDHVTPGNWRAINHLHLKNLKTGRQKEVRMNSGDMIDPVFLEKKTCQYLYKDATATCSWTTTATSSSRSRRSSCPTC
jgi:elongation factor P